MDACGYSIHLPVEAISCIVELMSTKQLWELIKGGCGCQLSTLAFLCYEKLKKDNKHSTIKRRASDATVMKKILEQFLSKWSDRDSIKEAVAEVIERLMNDSKNSTLSQEERDEARGKLDQLMQDIIVCIPEGEDREFASVRRTEYLLRDVAETVGVDLDAHMAGSSSALLPDSSSDPVAGSSSAQVTSSYSLRQTPQRSLLEHLRGLCNATLEAAKEAARKGSSDWEAVCKILDERRANRQDPGENRR